MKMLRQLAIILLIYFVGNFIQSIFHLPIPGTVLGMIFLLTSLCTGLIKVEMVEDVANFLLDHLAFFFLPAGVGLISCVGVIKGSITTILIVTFLSTIVIMSTTGIIVQKMKK